MKKNIKIKKKLALYKSMVLIRKTEEKLIELHPEQQMKTPFHLYIGQEAVASGICIDMKKDDLVFSSHRSHGHYLAKGGDLKKFFSEMYNKDNGCSKGRGGSMHLIDVNAGHMGSSSIVAGSIPIAVGAALALKKKNKNNVIVSFFGDGAIDEGVLYESFNFSSLHKLNIIFVCENNKLSVNSPLKVRRLRDNLVERAASFDVFAKRIDGNDVLKINDIFNNIRKKQIKKSFPVLLECDTYRIKGHIGIDDDVIPGIRDEGEISEWKKRCPILSLEKKLIKSNLTSKKNLEKLKDEIDYKIKLAVNHGRQSPLPKTKDLLKNIFA